MDAEGDGNAAPHRFEEQAADVAVKKEPPSPTTASAASDTRRSELSRLFIVCGRGRNVDDLRSLFSTCGAIKQLHLALDRSKKSRGFAFLQYEDPANARVAIEKLDQMKLDDGHILKVTIAKERPMNGNGKLKRNQHARQDLDGRADEDRQEDDGGIDARAPGKRQRSSPPAAALTLAPTGIRASPAFLLDNHCLERIAAAPLTTRLLETETTTNEWPALGNEALVNSNAVQKQVLEVLQTMVDAVEQHESQNLFTTYQRAISSVCDQIKRDRGSIITGATKTEDEVSTDLLASSIRSVSLAPKPIATRGSSFTAQRTPSFPTREAPTTHSSKQYLRRRRQSLEDSGLSTDGSDGGGIRRKRSNTTASPTPALNTRSQGYLPWSPPRKFPDRTEILEDEIMSKKQCKRQSSDIAIEGLCRLTQQQASRENHRREDSTLSRERRSRNTADIVSCYGNSGVKLEPGVAGDTNPIWPARAKLFFTSTHKFTIQELEAMFAVYGDFDSVEVVRSFGRVKTMAYIHYSKPSTAEVVVKSFREESSQGEEDPENAEFMALSFAHDSRGALSRSHHPSKKASIHSTGTMPHPPGLATDYAPAAAPASSVMAPDGKCRLWVLLLYDRLLATHMLSSVVSSFTGMEFMDIKIAKSTGEAQGVAFVKFDSEPNAAEAALQLHHMELPLGSSKFLQAIVIVAPELFTTVHGSNANNDSMRLDRCAGDRVVTTEDVDLRAVEARFVHLMRNNEHPHPREGYCFPQQVLMPPPCGSRAANNLEPRLSPMSVHPQPFTSMNVSGLNYYPMQLISYPPPPQQLPYGNYGESVNYQQHRHYGASVSTWMEATPYYQSEAPQYPYSCGPEQDVAFPVSHDDHRSVMSHTEAHAYSSKPRTSRPPSEHVDNEDGNSSCSSQTSASILVSTSEPLELLPLVSALQDCPGVVSFTKDTTTDLAGYTVDFVKEAQAFEAAQKLDGSIWGGQRLRVVRPMSTRNRGGGGGKARVGSGRRKRQRVDLRNRK